MLAATVKYAAANGLCLLIDMVIGYVLIETADLSATISLTVSTAINIPLLFLISRHLVFQSGENNIAVQFGQFLMTCMAVFCARQLLILLIHSFDLNMEHAEYFTLGAAIGFTFVLSFSLSKFWVFRPVQPKANEHRNQREPRS